MKSVSQLSCISTIKVVPAESLQRTSTMLFLRVGVSGIISGET